MSSLGDLLRGGAATTPAVSRPSGFSSKLSSAKDYIARSVWSSKQEVGNSPDLERIVNLPRRNLVPPVDEYWNHLKRDACSISNCSLGKGLKPIQAAALSEIEAQGGGIVWAGVGSGKFGIAALSGEVVRADTTILLVPPSAKPQVLERDLPHWQAHWKVPNCRDVRLHYPDTRRVLHVVSYSTLSHPKTYDHLENLVAEAVGRGHKVLIVADESHSVKGRSVRAKRFKWAFRGRSVGLVALSGTPGWSIKHQWHLCNLALGTGSPLPRTYPVVEEWAQALDPGDFISRPGALERLATESGEDVVVSFRKRFLSTPGVICTQEPSVGTPLNFHLAEVEVPPDAAAHLQHLRDAWETPGGEQMQDAIVFWQHARELACGMYLKWTWPRGEPLDVRMRWLAARKAYFSEVRDFIQHRARPGCDSPFLYSEAIRRGDLQSDTWAEWQEVKDTAAPVTEPVWLSDFLLNSAIAWAKEHNGIIWYETAAVGERLAQLSGLPLYGGGKKASSEILKETGERSIVASIDAHHQSKNLQQFSKQLFLAPVNAELFEQAIGRVHRQGQEAASVDIWLYLHTPEFRKTYAAARTRAAHVFKRDMAPQKILYGSYTFPVDSDPL